MEGAVPFVGQRTNAHAYLCVQSCEQHTDEILQRLPADWGIELAAFKLQLQERLFDPHRWKAVVQNYFDLLAQC